MIKEIDQKKFWELYKKLPEEEKDFLFSENLSKSLEIICKKNNIEDVSGFSVVICKLLLGMIDIKKTMEIIKNELVVNFTLLKKIENDIQIMIISSIPTTSIAQNNASTKHKQEKNEEKGGNNSDFYREPIK